MNFINENEELETRILCYSLNNDKMQSSIQMKGTNLCRYMLYYSKVLVVAKKSGLAFELSRNISMELAFAVGYSLCLLSPSIFSTRPLR